MTAIEESSVIQKKSVPRPREVSKSAKATFAKVGFVRVVVVR
jgi:hypothetical protein